MVEYNCPRESCKYSGSWLGLISHHRQSHDKDLDKSHYLLKEIHVLHDKLGRVPKQDDMTKYGEFGHSSYQYEFGGWNAALEEAGYPLNEIRDVSKNELIDELQRLERELGRSPYAREMSELSKFGHGTYSNYFGSWNKALESAGIEITHKVDKSSDGVRWKLAKWAKLVKRRDSYKCKDCGSTENLHAHHIKRKRDYPEKMYNLDNGVTLCVSCHAERHKEDYCYGLLKAQAKHLSKGKDNS